MYSVPNALLVYAHENLAGGEFYELQDGDNVTAVFTDGTSALYEVETTAVYIARSTDMASNGGDFEVRLNNTGEWLMISGVIGKYSKKSNIVLMTCFGGNVTTGRLFVRLVEVE